MRKIGVTGQNGFVGYHLTQTILLNAAEFELVNFNRSFFDDTVAMDKFVSQCDVIIHLAALNRHNEPNVIYDVNTKLVKKIILSLERTGSKAHIIVSSSTQEGSDSLYGKSKKEGRLMLANWSKNNGGRFTGMIIPNVYGPFGSPFYNSVIATFCHQIAHDINPKIEIDGQLKLIYVGELVEEIIKAIKSNDNSHELKISNTAEARVSEVLAILQNFKEVYQDKGEFPQLNSSFEFKLFNTFRSYMDIQSYFPRKLLQNIDSRGSFVEIARHGIPGQTSFSTTVPNITRGNHFHTRKIERFAVIKGKALIQLRKIGTNKVLDFYLDGSEPAYVDMPIWYTHSIKNVGEDTLFTIFWINEPYNPSDPDTYIENVK